MQKTKRKRLSCHYRQCNSTVLVSCFMSMRCTGFNYLKQEMLKSAALHFFISSVRSPPASTSRPSAMTPASEIEHSNKFSLPAQDRSLRITCRLYTEFQRVRFRVDRPNRRPKPQAGTASKLSSKYYEGVTLDRRCQTGTTDEWTTEPAPQHGQDS